jgi:segregation and condensation protein A
MRTPSTAPERLSAPGDLTGESALDEQTLSPESGSADAAQPAETGQRADNGVTHETTGEGFNVRLDNFEGPFDLLLQLISRHKMDITEVALSRVTDEFIAHIKMMGADWDLDQTSQFVVVGATLLDLKAARLLPSGEVEDPDDLAILEARDLLFARLLQYRAFKQMADRFDAMLHRQDRRSPRTAGPDPQFLQLLPEVAIPATPEGLAELAAGALTHKPAHQLALNHLHAPVVSVREQAAVVVDRLRHAGELRFSDLVSDAPDNLTTVCRFLALLELFRREAVCFEQPTPLERLVIRWTQPADPAPTISDEFDIAPQHLPAPRNDDTAATGHLQQAEIDQPRRTGGGQQVDGGQQVGGGQRAGERKSGVARHQQAQKPTRANRQ